MRFGPWYPLAECAPHATAIAGVLQLRIATGLIDYPTGKSAMIHYRATRNVRAAIAELAARHVGRSWLCRFTIAMTASEAADVERAAEDLLDTFTRRFGAAPTLP